MKKTIYISGALKNLLFLKYKIMVNGQYQQKTAQKLNKGIKQNEEKI
jgi:hypothetical protein